MIGKFLRNIIFLSRFCFFQGIGTIYSKYLLLQFELSYWYWMIFSFYFSYDSGIGIFAPTVSYPLYTSEAVEKRNPL